MNAIGQNIRMFLWLTLLTGVLYPLFIMLIAQLVLKPRADGDFVIVNEKKVGAKLIGQKFESARYFWPRPSAVDYNPLSSGGSNLGPTSRTLQEKVIERREKLTKAHNVKPKEVPPELLFASGSGLDPHITPLAAHFQVERIAKARGLPKKAIQDLVQQATLRRLLGFIGEERINVLLLNQALDTLSTN